MQTHEDKQKVWFTFTSQVKEKSLKQPLSKTMANLFFHSCREKMAARAETEKKSRSDGLQRFKWETNWLFLHFANEKKAKTLMNELQWLN